ncbi:MAG: helix-turn-helix transcriptional regulator [Bacteroidota bacterium]|nr:helix-turn-helix transcriptional regulator [Bacteroidota bacterium]
MASRRPILLTRADEMLLVSILVLNENAFSTTIKQELYQRMRKRISVGSLWVALDQLAGRGMVEKEPRKNPDRKGGRPRVYYRVTALGKKSLKKTRDMDAKLWKGVKDLLENVK